MWCCSVSATGLSSSASRQSSRSVAGARQGDGVGGHKPIPGRRWRLVVRAFFVPVAPLSHLRARIASVGIPSGSPRHWRSHRRRALRSHPAEWTLGIQARSRALLSDGPTATPWAGGDRPPRAQPHRGPSRLRPPGVRRMAAPRAAASGSARAPAGRPRSTTCPRRSPSSASAPADGSGSTWRWRNPDGAPPEAIAGDGKFRLGTRAGDFDRCERPSAGETLRR